MSHTPSREFRALKSALLEEIEHLDGDLAFPDSFEEQLAASLRRILNRVDLALGD